MAKFTHIIFVLLFSLTVVLNAMADTISGGDTVKQHLAILDHDPDNKEALKAVAFHYLNVGNDEEAKKYGNKLLSLAEKNNDRNFCELYGRIIIGATLTQNSDKQPEAFQQLQQALAIAESSQNNDALVSIYNSLGIYYLFFHNDPYTATSYYYSALDAAKAIGDSRRQAIITSNIAGCYLVRNDISGQTLAEEAHEMAVKQNEIVPLYYAKSNLFHYYLMSGRIDDAERVTHEIEQLHKDGEFAGNVDQYIYRAQLAEKKGDTKKAYEYYARAMEDFGNADKSTVSATYLHYAQLLRKEHHLKAAINILEYGLSNATDSRTMIHTPEILKELALCYSDSGNFRKALEYSMRYQEHQDSTMEISRERVLQETRIKHDIYSRERKISEQTIELLANRNKIIILISILIALTLLLAMLYYIHKKKDRLYSAIVTQNRDYINREKSLLEQIEKLRDTSPQPTSATQQTTNPLPEDKMNDLMSRFTICMVQDKLFTDPSLTVASVADHLKTNRTYLSKAINESTGKTFTQIVNEYRIREAIALISDLEANLPLKQVAADVGFNSISTFYVTFQASTGMTPARYRSKLKDI